MNEEVVFLLEESSAGAMLEGVLPRLGIPLPEVRFMIFEGKSDLEKRVEGRLRGYLNRQARFILIRDQDSAPDCKALKSRLSALCARAGRPETIVRIFCHELEEIYLADLAAIERAYSIPGLSVMQQKAKYRAPSRLITPSTEVAALTKGRYQKVGGSRLLGKELDVHNRRSNSFAVLIDTLRAICAETA